MNIKKILTTALVGLPLLAWARPASPEVMTTLNPDGSVVNFRLHGNEQFSFFTDVDGKTVLDFDANGYMKPVWRNGRVMTTAINDINLLRAEQVPVVQQRSAAISRMAQLNDDGRSTYPTIGDVPALVILIEYADTPFSTENPKETFDKLCNQPGYSDYGGVGSARDYYIDASNGMFRPQFDVYGPVKLSHPAAFYVGDDPKKPDYGKCGNFGYAIEEAVKALDSEIDYSKYDLDNDGKIDNIFFFYSGRGQADTGNKTLVWPHQADFIKYTNIFNNTIQLDRLFVDGVEMRTYACSNELNSSSQIPSEKQPYIDGIGAFVHEYGHVIGLPDLYDVEGGTTSTPGRFDVMDRGSYNLLSARPPMFSAYEKWVCNWLEFEEAQENTAYTLPSISTGKNAKAVRIRTRRPGGGVRYTNECFIFESRTAEGWDESLSQDGLLIWHVNYDSNAWSNNVVNVSGMANVDIVRPEKKNREIVVWPGDLGKYTYLTPETPDFTLKPYKNPDIFKAWISNIAYDPETKSASFEYNMYKEIPEMTTVLHDKPAADPDSHDVTLVWDNADGATDYLLTVQYKDLFGRWSTYGDLDACPVGNNTTFVIKNIPTEYWKSQFTAFVVPYRGYPSSNPSNSINFVPSDLDNTAVEVIEADTVGIFGLNGRIEAPAGARVFNINGVETGKDNLPAGIYIVVLNGKTAKVVVK